MPNFNPFVFDKIDKISAYWLGYLFADGNTCQTTGNRNMTSLGSIDIDILIKFAKFLGLPKDRIKKKPKGFAVAVCNQHLHDTLVSYGCVNRKTRILDKPKIPKKYFIAFLAGFYDGDGCLSLNSSINSWKASVGCASIKFVNWFTEILDNMNLVYYRENKTTKNGPFYNIVLTGIYARKFCEILYDSVPEHLPMKRKKDKYKQLCNIKLKWPRWTKWEIEILRSTLSTEKCIDKINNHPKNIGWNRTLEGTARKRRYLSG